ncbi:type IV pilin-like G/H family protein [Nostoc sp. CALU 546]|uniref:type IV pilin-like G/H family protein n=1 Tax=Nostoc sp. CALU 546 TaxID=1867241 RepID=UPI003B67CB6E
MKTELKAKFIQHILNKKKENEGFTLIELLVVIIIIGILSAIALPSFLNQANKAKQSEAKTIVGSMNRAQQAYYLENNRFVGEGNEEFGKLALGVKTQTENYVYAIEGGGPADVTQPALTMVTNQAQLLNDEAPLKAYIGGVAVSTVTETSEATTIGLLCEAGKSGNVPNSPKGEEAFAAAEFPDDAAAKCPDNYVSLSK